MRPAFFLSGRREFATALALAGTREKILHGLARPVAEDLVRRLERRDALDTEGAEILPQFAPGEKIYAPGHADLAALSDFPGTRKFFFGERPTLADAGIFGLTINIIGPDMASPLKDAALGYANVVRHAERMGEVFASTRPREFRAVA